MRICNASRLRADAPPVPDREDTVELSSSAATDRPSSDAPAEGGRPYLRLYFRCSNQYVRAYRNAAGESYLGRCPTCGKTISFAVGPGGTSERFFQVSCR